MNQPDVAAWLAVWQRRKCTLDLTNADILQALIDVDGFDSGAGRIKVDAWRNYVASVAGSLGLSPGKKVFEVGCGAGAFLYVLRELGAVVSGIDYAENLVHIAQEAIPDGVFCHAEALHMSVADQVDHVVANSVFHYFPTEAYADAVLCGMMNKTRTSLAILEVPDAASQAASERARRACLSEQEYEIRYKNLAHRYYLRDWFYAMAEKNGFSCSISDQSINGYAQNQFRFNCFMVRK
jgi:SAM-dependent methyltransferase